MSLRRWVKDLIVAIGFGDRLIEYCNVCGIRQPLVWWAENELWLKLVGSNYGALCPRCFDKRAYKAGLYLTWKPENREFDKASHDITP